MRRRSEPLDDESSGFGEVDEDPFDDISPDPVEFDEDTYSMTVVQMVGDLHEMTTKKVQRGVLMSRFATTLFLIFLTVFLKVFLLCQVKRFVSAKAVHDVRLEYAKYQVWMYANVTQAPSERRLKGRGSSGGSSSEVASSASFAALAGVGGRSDSFAARLNEFDINEPYVVDPTSFDPSRFEHKDMPDDLKEQVCKIPLSQPCFFWSVLFLWTATCIQETRKTKHLFVSLVLNTKVATDMSQCYQGKYEHFEDGIFVIQQLTRAAKSLVTVLLAVRMAMILFLLWLGCRWLLATNDFSDLILNAVALEFILLIKDTTYFALMPNRFRIELTKARMLPQSAVVHADYWQFVSVITWFTIASAWVTLYMFYLQQVLPNYNWDVGTVCTDWLAERFRV